MRTLHADLTAAQKALTIKALVKIQLTQGANDYTYTQTRILDINHTEQPYNQVAEVILNNSDGTLTSINFVGYKGVISWGMTDASAVDRFSACAPLWVIGSQLQSWQGHLTLKLALSGIPNRLDVDKPSAAFALESDDQQTTKDLLTQVVKAILPARANASTYVLDDLVIAATTNGYVYKCTTAGTSAASAPTLPLTIGNTVTDSSVVWTNKGREITVYSHCAAYTITVDSEDSLFDSYTPKESFNIGADPENSLSMNTSRLAAIRWLLRRTKDCFRAEDDGEVHFLQPTVSGTVYAYEYSLSTGEHTFWNKTYRNRLVVPNYVVVESLDSDDGYSAYAEDTASSVLSMREYHKLPVASTAEASAIAGAILEKYQSDADKGSGLVPINVGQEIYDWVKITDSRENDNREGNVGTINRIYQSGQWVMSIHFGSGVGGVGTGPTYVPDEFRPPYPPEPAQLYPRETTKVWQKIFNGKADTPGAAVAWGYESPLPFTNTGNVYFSPIVSNVVYMIDRGLSFWKYNMATSHWTALAAPANSGESCYRTLALSPNGSTLACPSQGNAVDVGGRVIEFYDIAANTWSASTTPVDISASSAKITSIVWEDNDILWAWCKRQSVLNGQCQKYVKSTDTWTAGTALTAAQTVWNGGSAAEKSNSTIVYGGGIGSYANKYFKYTVATDAYAESSMTTDNSGGWAYDKDKLWFFNTSTASYRQGYMNTADESNNPNIYAANTARGSNLPQEWGVGDDLNDIIAYARTTNPKLMSVRNGGTYLLGTQTFKAFEMVVVFKPDDNYPVMAVMSLNDPFTPEAYSISIERTTTMALLPGTWSFYYSVLGDYTQVQIYRWVTG